MPTKPLSKATSKVDVVKFMNSVRDSADANYQSLVPEATISNSKQIGSILYTYNTLANTFIRELVNRIAKVIITSKMNYTNPWSFMKKGELEVGEYVEEIFVDLIKGYRYDIKVAESHVFDVRNPNVKSAFHEMNFKAYYPVTIANDDIKLAFISWSGVEDLIARIVKSVYTSYQYDEFNIMKYMLGRAVLDGNLHIVYDSLLTTKEDMESTAAKIKAVSNSYEFMSSDYNKAGVNNYSLKADQYLIMSAMADAYFDVNVLASSFNMDKVEFMGHRITVDSFSSIDEARLTTLLSNEITGESEFIPFTADEKTALESISAILIDGSWMQIYEILQKFNENFNGLGDYWNYFYHVRGVFSYSPFANATVFITGSKTDISSVSAGVVSKTTTGTYTQLILKPEFETTGLVGKRYAFLQTPAMTEVDITITEEGLVTIPANSAGSNIQLMVEDVIYQSSEPVTGAETVGADSLTFEKVG